MPPGSLARRKVTVLYGNDLVVSVKMVVSVLVRARVHSHKSALFVGFSHVRRKEFLSLGCCQHFASLGVAG